MAAYAVIARIGRVDPHLSVRDLERDLDDDPTSGGGTDDSIEAVDLRSEPGRLEERLMRWRELWTQTTFFLFDAESWRT
jgi:hypothetical protein